MASCQVCPNRSGWLAASETPAEKVKAASTPRTPATAPTRADRAGTEDRPRPGSSANLAPTTSGTGKFTAASAAAIADRRCAACRRRAATSGIGFQLAPDFQPPRWPDPDRPQQMHFDIMVDDVEAAEPRVLALGARPLPGGDSHSPVYADPAGHPFCLIPRPRWAPPIGAAQGGPPSPGADSPGPRPGP